MRLLTILPDLTLGGRQRAAQNYALGYARAGHPSAVLAYRTGGPREAMLREGGVPVFVGPDAEAAAAVWQPDVLHVHTAGTLIEAEVEVVDRLRARLGARVPVLETTAFGRVAFSRTDLPDIRLLMTRWALWRWQERSRTVSDPPPGAIVPITIEPDAFFPAPREEVASFRERLGIRPGAVVVGSLARPAPLKWPPLLLDAFAHTLRHRPEAEILAGAFSDEANAWLGALPSDLRARVHTFPSASDDAELRLRYSAMDVFAHACLIGETFGLVFAEAMACGTPVVTLSTPGRNNSQVEVVGPGGLAAHGARAYHRALDRLVADAALRDRLGAAGRAHVRERYATDAVIPTLLRIAEAAQEAPSRDDLRRRLDDLGLAPTVDTREIHDLVASVEGPPSLRQTALMRITNHPFVAAVWDRVHP